jgi:small multidrug resistance pump
MPVLSVSQAWAILAGAILFEVAGSVCMRLSEGLTRLTPSVMIFVFYGISFALNTMVVRTLGLGTVYAVWSGVGTVLVATIGYYYFEEPMSVMKVACMGLIVMGVIGVNASSQ